MVRIIIISIFILINSLYSGAFDRNHKVPSWGSNNNKGSLDHGIYSTTQVPIHEDALIISKFNLADLREKSGFNNPRQFYAYNYFLDEIYEEARRANETDIFNMMVKYFENPNLMGIDLDSDSYLYIMADERRSRPLVFCLMKVTDKQQLHESIEMLDFENEFDYQLENESFFYFLNDYTSLRDDSSIMMINDDYLLICMQGPYGLENTKLMDLVDPSSNTINSKEFSQFQSSQEDIGLFINLDLFNNFIRDEFSKQSNFSSNNYNPMDKLVQDNILYFTDIFLKNKSISAFISANDDNIKLTSQINGLNRNEIINFESMFGSFDSRILKHLPSNPLMLLSMSIDWGHQHQYISELLSKSSLANDPSYRTQIQPAILGFKPFFEAFGDEFVITLEDIELGGGHGDPYPMITLATSINSVEYIDALIQMVFQNNLRGYNGDYYINFNDLGKVYIVYNDSYFMITNNQKTYQAFWNGGYEKSLKESKLASKISSHSIFEYINLDFSSYNSELYYLITRLLVENDINPNKLGIFHSFEASAESISNGSLELNLKSIPGNSLFNIFSLIDNFIEEELRR